VDGAADFFVEEGVARVLLDLVVRADCAFAQEAAAGVHVEHGEEKILALRGAGVDDFAVLERQSHAVAFAAVMNGGEREIDLAFDAFDHRAGANFAVGEIFVAVAIDPGVAGDGHFYVGAVGGDDVVVALAVEEIDQPLLPLAHLPPGCDRIGAIEQAGAEDEVFVLRQAHLRVLRGGLRGELRARPVQCAFAGALHENVP
jgi:hypothetical protein